MGLLESANAPRDGSGKGTAFVTEQITLEKGVGKSGDIHGDERTVASTSGCVDRSRNDFLTGTSLSGDEDGFRGIGDPLDESSDLVHIGAGADQNRIGALAALQTVLYTAAKSGQVEGGGKEVHGTQTEGLDRGSDVSISRMQDDGNPESLESP